MIYTKTKKSCITFIKTNSKKYNITSRLQCACYAWINSVLFTPKICRSTWSDNASSVHGLYTGERSYVIYKINLL